MEKYINWRHVRIVIIFCLMLSAIVLCLFFLRQHLRNQRNIHYSLADIKRTLLEDYIQTNLYNNPKYNGKKLNKNEFQVFSQAGEDGIIEEIFNRIGSKTNYFVEFGAGDGSENNTIYPLIKGWKGLWIECDKKCILAISRNYKNIIHDGKLKVRQDFVTAENIEDIFAKEGVQPEFDLLSIDIDRNDYWVWKSITKYRPRVVVIEYNATFSPTLEWIVKYNPNAQWDGSSYFGASLKSLEILGNKKGYRLVGCSFSGVNAFFVREDLVKNKFCEPFTAENHYEPPRYFAIKKPGHSTRFGDFVRE